MELNMYLKDELIDSLPILLLNKKTIPQKYLRELMDELSRKHKILISKSGTEPYFSISGVGSSMNNLMEPL
jgi:hypothetical protein